MNLPHEIVIFSSPPPSPEQMMQCYIHQNNNFSQNIPEFVRIVFYAKLI